MTQLLIAATAHHRSRCLRGVPLGTPWHKARQARKSKEINATNEAAEYTKIVKERYNHHMNNTDFTDLYGKSTPFSDHKEGAEIKFHDFADGTVKQGKILHVRAPGKAIKGGDDHPVLYIVDCNEGMPVPVAPSQIVEGPFTAVIGTYGLPDSQLQGRGQAEDVVWHLDTRGKYIIDTDHGRLRVISAHIEGDEKAGKVIAKCEAVEEDH